MFRLGRGLERPFDRSQILEPKCWKFMRHVVQSVTVLWAVLSVCVVICEINCTVMCVRPEMAIKLGFTR